MVEGNSSFSTTAPGLQIAWDSTSLNALKTCPRKYYYSLILGWTPRTESVHLTFGLLYHAALERYDHLRAQGIAHAEALCATTLWALRATWDSKLKRPWTSDDHNKNRWTLIRTIVWYLDQFENDPMQTVVLANGKPAVELSFRIDLDQIAPTGESYVLCGHLDRLATLDGVPYIADRKTTKSTIYPSYFDKYTPDNQFSCYTLAGHVAWGIPVRGIIVDVAQIAVSFSRFVRAPVLRDAAQIAEWLSDTHAWIRVAEGYATSGHWPQNDTACDHYGGCPYRPVCSKSPASRDRWLEAGYVKRTWDPLQRRGDI